MVRSVIFVRPLRPLRSLIMLAWLICSSSQHNIRLTEQTAGMHAITYAVKVCYV